MGRKITPTRTLFYVLLMPLIGSACQKQENSKTLDAAQINTNDQSTSHVPVIGGPCEGCENVFLHLPKLLEFQSRIAPVGEPGEALQIEGIVSTATGEPAQNIVVYAYHTDKNGIYLAASTAHGQLRAWVRTDQQGRYRFDTIRPGAYPDGTNPQHVHMHVIENDKGTYYIDDLIFDDDPLLHKEAKSRVMRGRGGFGLTHPVKNAQGVWQVRRNIVLGKNIPDYPG